ncbi:MAG: DUF5660 domain-containing protein [Candidatus Pacebacteria bacterium]|nr:DUF5660 domain-containing protein [Candidatus Paceibacterota bacterium]
MDPFAQALQANSKSRGKRKAPALSPELEKNLSSKTPQKSGLNPFSEALARTGGSNFDNVDPNDISQVDLEKQKLDLEKKQKKEALRQKLHKEINPVDMRELYSAHEEKTKRELEQVRKELRVFASEITKFYKEVDVALFQEVVSPGQEGTGLRAYFDKIRQFIKLLRKKVHSARTWMHTQNAKSKKQKRGKGRKGIEVSGQKHEQTKAVFDQMHHEQSTVYSGN